MANLYNYNTNCKFNDYLSKSDLINKYNFKNLYEIPRLKKINVEINFKDFLIASGLSEQEQTNSMSQIKSYLLLYCLLGVTPYLNCNKNSLVKFSKNLDINYSLKLVFSSAQEQVFFLNSLFIENWETLKLDGVSLFKSASNFNLSTNSKQSVFNTQLPGNFFFELEDLFNKNVNTFNLKLLKFHTNFLISNVSVTNSKQLIKNLQYFWING